MSASMGDIYIYFAPPLLIEPISQSFPTFLLIQFYSSIKQIETAMDQKEESTQKINFPGLTTGLELMGKVTMNASEWAGKFAETQIEHYPDSYKPKTFFGRSIVHQFNHHGLSRRQCCLCMLEKHRTEFVHMCRCSHEFCFSCLNSYAISKVDGMEMVVCPQQQCGEIMHLSSKVYRFLPDTTKIKYLQNKSVFKFDKNKEEDRCPRCLYLKHEGTCKISLQPKVLQNTFAYRKCPRCESEIYMSEGRKRVVCKNCHHAMCYLCHQQWRQVGSGKKHECQKKGQISALEKEFNETQCCNGAECCSGCECDCDYCGCNEDIDCHCDLECECCRNCDEDCCCELLVYFGDGLSPFCVLINLLSIPFRLILTALLMVELVLFMVPLSFVFFAWLIIGIVGGFTAVFCELASNAKCPLSFFMFFFYPITALICTVYTMYEVRSLPAAVYQGFFEMQFEILGTIWVNCSPKECLS